MSAGKTSASGARAAPGGLAKVAEPQAATILARYEPSEPAAALATAELSPRRFVDKLLAEGLSEDAISFLAYALPRRDALRWALGCVRAVTPEKAPKEVAAAIAAADAWIAEPSEERRRASMAAAEEATYGTPSGCLALAVFFSEGSLSPPEAPPVPVGEWFCARTVAAAILLASMAKEPAEIPALARRFAEAGVEAANARAPWDPPA